jgi:caa(3)-type oxidase subunit IV
MIVAAIKAALVALVFMHLNHERSLIYKVLAFTGFFLISIFVLIYLTHGDLLAFEGFDGYKPPSH